ncbi:hypothetical protein BU23DRAFT_495539 [Bimuria novae-zelandiae CBS 107.79]|uniref:Uncharacterized protein n=1 Tax=Bimuria novae-zelandiae CBS 107.79 TaxID=1447943 RepID=A0A6A5VZA2_9PLEO|nr:hypothetical protein BU23DRAFT_495539 [Bimuria novae-zelandiae CBS 107.79]
MPRPKRTKVASTAPRVAKPSKPAEPPVTTQKQSKSRKLAVSKPLDSFSEDSDRIVVVSTRARRQAPQSESQDEVEYTMTGALPVASETDASSKNRTPPRPSRRTRMSKSSAPGSSSKKSSMAAAQTDSAQKDTSHVEAEQADSSGFGDHLLSFTSLGSDSPAHGTRPPSAIKVGATPAHEKSILALTNFKRRARQPSLLRMVHQTTELADNDGENMDLYADDMDDFHPNAESTPLPKQQAAPGKEGATDSGVNLSSSSSRGTKRKLSPVVQVPRSSPPYDLPSGPDLESRSPSPSLPDVVRSTVEHQSQDEDEEAAEPSILSETMAPPMSSSDYAADEIQDPATSPVAQKGRRGRAPSARREEEDPEAEQDDHPRKSKAKQKSKPNKGISTAKLQALLPKRRTRAIHEDSYSASLIDSDEDELSMPPRRHAQLARKFAATKASKKPARAAKKPTTAATATKGSKTYGRRISSDKENEGRVDVDDGSEDEDEDSGHTEIANDKPSSHLQAMAKKFEDIDAFDLDFESVSYVQTSSSPSR